MMEKEITSVEEYNKKYFPLSSEIVDLETKEGTSKYIKELFEKHKYLLEGTRGKLT